jgi:hypothetical protein
MNYQFLSWLGETVYEHPYLWLTPRASSTEPNYVEQSMDDMPIAVPTMLHLTLNRTAPQVKCTLQYYIQAVWHVKQDTPQQQH